MIERNKHVDGRILNIVFGLCAIADGLIRVLSMGFLHTTLTLDYARNQVKRRFEKMKEAK